MLRPLLGYVINHNFAYTTISPHYQTFIVKSLLNYKCSLSVLSAFNRIYHHKTTILPLQMLKFAFYLDLNKIRSYISTVTKTQLHTFFHIQAYNTYISACIYCNCL